MTGPAPRFRQRAARVLGHVAVVIGVLAVIAAAFALSYDAVRDIARSAGVPVALARIYPGILDAVFLVACAAALMLRDARWWTRLYAWLSVLVTGGLIGAAGAYHAMGLRLPHRATAGTVAALPWALVMLAFSLWLSMLRHTRSGPARPLTRAASPAARAALPAPEPDGAAPPSVENMEGHAPENPPPAGATAAESPGERPADRAEPTQDNGTAQEAEAGDGDGDDEVLGDQEDGPSSPAGPHPADADTPPYGFPAVTDRAAGNGSGPEAPDHAGAAPAPRTPTLLSAPVPADVAAPAEAGPEPAATAAPPAPDPEPEDVAARGRPPAAGPELPDAEAELAHEARPAGPAGDAAPPAAGPPDSPDEPDGPKRPPASFERVRSTPTRPAAPEEG
jgi:hypothetical protein